MNKTKKVVAMKLTPRHFKDRTSISKLTMSLDYIFGRGTSKALKSRKLAFEYSRRTGRLKYVTEDGSSNILFTFRTNGSIAPTVLGTKLLLSRISRNERPPWVVTVIDGVSEVVSTGKTVFCKHVVQCGDSVRAGEDVAIMNESGDLLAVGRTVVSGPTMKQFKRGPAIKVREGLTKIGSDEL
ncbi:MAG: hypothetical protein JRN52_05545 [Nitrososphaerota archaeon]|nr:hypothetical protein [Nitrososphaerota archaeon]